MSSGKQIFPIFDKQRWSDFTQRAQIKGISDSSSVLEAKHSPAQPINPKSHIEEQKHTSEENKSESADVAHTPNTQTGKKKRVNYAKGSPAERMRTAVEYLQTHRSENYQDVAFKFMVDRKSLRMRVEGELTLDSHVGNKGFLTMEQEQKLVQHCLDMARLGYGYDVLQIRNIVRYYLKDKECEVTSGWWQKFKERHPEITRRRGEALEVQRASALNAQNIAPFFEKLKLAFTVCKRMSGGVDVTSARIYNMDEVGFDLNSIKGYVITQKGVRNVPLVTSGNRTHVTVIACVNAMGLALDPLFLLPGVRRRPNFNLNKFTSADQMSTGSGWINAEAFKDWCQMFINQTKDFRGNNHWSILLLDGHSTHTHSLEALSLLNENLILALSLPSHTTSVLQPLDVSVFKPLKTLFQGALQDWRLKTKQRLTIDDLPTILGDCWDSAFTNSNIKSGFRKTGIFPLNENWVEENKSVLTEGSGDKSLQFDRLIKRTKAFYGGEKEVLKACDYLDLAYDPKGSLRESGRSDFADILDSIFNRVSVPSRDPKQLQKKRFDRLGENPSEARILNSTERLNSIRESDCLRGKNTKTVGKQVPKRKNKIQELKDSPMSKSRDRR